MFDGELSREAAFLAVLSDTATWMKTHRRRRKDNLAPVVVSTRSDIAPTASLVGFTFGTLKRMPPTETQDKGIDSDAMEVDEEGIAPKEQLVFSCIVAKWKLNEAARVVND